MQALDQHRIMRKRSWSIDECAEQLVISRGREAEIVANRLFLRAGVPPPPSFKGEDRRVTLGKLCGRSARRREKVTVRRVLHS
jgi:hypothetical protein